MNVVAVIPARYASTRFEGKAIVDIAGKPMIQHVYERSICAEKLSQVIVATDDQRIYNVVEGFGGQAMMTPEAETGSDRIAIVIEDINCEVVVNIQGDEPLIEPEMINQLIQPFFDDASVEVSTLKQKIDNEADYLDPNVVKIVTDLSDYALYFSRAPIPGGLERHREGHNLNFRHLGLYAYKKQRLIDFVKWDRTPYEMAEGLEQLRFLENGVRISVVETEYPAIGVDTPNDLERVRKILEKGAFAS
ncbi:MAG: 3-deoxy-manno-octulosonate cytidylyltransferase [Candidatus Poribacteria bacterium]|nr:3-deoxy-manno-octulosonate cytidylyltransferase [Candidatus Poribacteria bacterium]MCS5611428.1 3-deoxy-manno-octulosonate cytidylyltransferase [Candidatus Poribacteria bacterium]